jgi:hypothetical protein
MRLRQDYAAALACAATVGETGEAMTGLLSAYWELATGAMLQGNESVVHALDVVHDNPYDLLTEEIGQLQEAADWYSRATGAYLELLVSEHFTAALALQLPALELTIVLKDTDGSLSGHTEAAHSLDFPIVDEASGRGPAVTGWWSGDSFELQSEVYTSSGVTGTRQVALHSGVITDSGETLTRVYGQALWGASPYPLTVSGDFALLRVTGPEYRVYLPLVPK